MKNGDDTFSLPDLSARQLITATVVVGLVALGFWILFRFNQVVLILLAGIIISLAISPAVSRLKARGIPPAVAIGLIYGLIFMIGVLFVRFGVPLIGAQAATIGAQASEGYRAILQNLRQAPSLLVQRLVDSLPAALNVTPAPPAATTDVATEVSTFEQVGRYLGMTSRALYHIAAMFLIAFFWTLEAERIKRSTVSLLPLNQRDSARDLIAEIEQRVGSYVNGQLLMSLIMGGLSLVAYLIIGLPYALVLALFVAVMEIVPLVGPIIGVIPAIIIGFSQSPATALWAVVASIIIHQLESNFLGPRVMKRTLGMRPLVTLLALTAFGTLFGILGAIVALPLASVLQLFFDRFLVDAPSRADSTGDRDRISLLRYETQEFVEDVRKMIRRRDSERYEVGGESETVEDTLEAIALDLDSLLAQFRDAEATQ